MTAVLESASTAAITSSGGVAVWVYDPWRERPRVAATALLSAVALCALVVAVREPFLVAGGLCVFCIAAFAPAITRAECRLDSAGAARRTLVGWERREWSGIRRVEALPAAVLLSPYPRPHWLDRIRAFTLPLPAARRDELLASVRALREAQGGERA